MFDDGSFYKIEKLDDLIFFLISETLFDLIFAFIKYLRIVIYSREHKKRVVAPAAR